MHAHWMDQYRDGSSRLHRLDARVKLALVIAYILAASLIPAGAWLAYALLLVPPFAGALVSGLGLRLVLRRALVALPFALAAVTVLFSTAGPRLFTLSLGPWRLEATEPGLVRFLSIVVKSWLSVQMAVLLAGTTPFPDLLNGMRALYFPRVLVAIVAFMWRYIFVLTDEALRLRRAREARSAVLPGRKGGGSIPWRARVAGGMAGNLFIRSYARSERIYQAMAARGYQGEWRALAPPRLQRRDLQFGLVVGAYMVVVLIAGVMLW